MPRIKLFMSVCMLSSLTISAHFDSRVLDAIKQDGFLEASKRIGGFSAQEKKEKIKTLSEGFAHSEKISYSTLHTCINIAAIAYATARIYARYTLIVPNVKPATTPASWWLALCPNLMHTVTYKASFFIGSVGIVLETLLYKTLAKWVVACGTHDIVDVAEGTIERGQEVATKIVW